MNNEVNKDIVNHHENVDIISRYGQIKVNLVVLKDISTSHFDVFILRKTCSTLRLSILQRQHSHCIQLYLLFTGSKR